MKKQILLKIVSLILTLGLMSTGMLFALAANQEEKTVIGWYKDYDCRPDSGSTLSDSCPIACGTGDVNGTAMLKGCQASGHGIWLNPTPEKPDGEYLMFDVGSSELLRAYLFYLQNNHPDADEKISLEVTGYRLTDGTGEFHATSIKGYSGFDTSFKGFDTTKFTYENLVPKNVTAKAGNSGTALVSFTAPVSAGAKSPAFGVQSYTVKAYGGTGSKPIKTVTVVNDKAKPLASVTINGLQNGTYTFTVAANYGRAFGSYTGSGMGGMGSMGSMGSAQIAIAYTTDYYGTRTYTSDDSAPSVSLTIIGSNAGTPSDTAGHWAVAVINKWITSGSVAWYHGGEFLPDAVTTHSEFTSLLNVVFIIQQQSDNATKLTRQDAAELIAERLGVNADVVVSKYYKGYDDGKLHLEETLTRTQAVALIDRVASDVSASGSAQGSQDTQQITTDFGVLWTSDIVVKVGVPVKWYVYAAPGSLPTSGMACGKTIKIPGMGWGTNSYNKDQGHLTLVEGSNFVYEFTPTEVGDILFTCWMGGECHGNYIHVTADGKYTPSTVNSGNDNAQLGHTVTLKFNYRTVDGGGRKLHIDGKATDVPPVIFEREGVKYIGFYLKSTLEYAGFTKNDVVKVVLTEINGGEPIEIDVNRAFTNTDPMNGLYTAFGTVDAPSERPFKVEVTLAGD